MGCGHGNRRRGAAAWRCLLAAWVAGGCHGGAPAESEYIRIVGAVSVGERVLTGPVQTGAEPVDLNRPTDLLVVGDSVYVVDNGNDRLVVLDRRLRVLGVLGREGEGPGEFQHPVAIRRSPGGVTAVDMGNTRFTEFDRSGRVVRTWHAPSGLHQFAMSPSGVVYVRSRTLLTQYLRIDGDSEVGFGVWPHPLAPGERAPLLPPEQTVEVTAGDTVHVFDEKDGVLYKYGPAGDLLLEKKLPAVVWDSVAGMRDRLIRGLAKSGYGVIDAIVSKDFEVTPDGDLLLLIGTGEIVGLLIDPRTYDARKIVVRPGPNGTFRFPFGEAAIVDSLLYVLSDHDIGAFRIEESR